MTTGVAGGVLQTKVLFRVLAPCSLGPAQDSGQPLGWRDHDPESSLKQVKPGSR